jgi:uncharacterized C2H2 Zn-finger protein
MGNRFQQFMVGRYGGDQLGVFLIVVFMIMGALTFFVPSIIIVLLSYAIFGWWLFRFLSRRITRRHEENQMFLKLAAPFISARKLWQRKFRERNTSKFYKCPQCRQNIRVPKGKGKIAIRCPKCGTEFVKRT